MADRPIMPPYVWKAERRAGYRWRVLAHKDGDNSLVVCKRCGFKGDYAKHPKRCDGTWEERQWISVVEMHSTDFAESVCFDELVIDDWFHLEQMDPRVWWMRVGPLNLAIHVRADGQRRLTGWWEDEKPEGTGI